MKYGVLYRSSATTGLFSYFITFCGGLKYCDENGFVPVIDMKNHDNLYRQSDSFNSWEWFFHQPGGCSLDQIDRENSCEIDVNGITDFPFYQFLRSANDDPDVVYWRGIVDKYIRLKHKNLEKYVNCRLDDALMKNRVLGILARGTDYTSNKPHGHPKQPSVETMIHDAKCSLRDKGFDLMYLTTEDIDIQNAFLREFGEERLICSRQEKLKAVPERKRLSNYNNIRGNVDFGLAYLKAIYDLSKCHGILAGRTSGTIGAKLLSTGFEYEHYYELGKYT